MKHAGEDAIAELANLRSSICQFDGLKEKKPGIFYRKAKPFLHFHEDPAGFFADVRFEATWERFPVSTSVEQQQLLDFLSERLSS
jgi:hypothetical protein